MKSSALDSTVLTLYLCVHMLRLIAGVKIEMASLCVCAAGRPCARMPHREARRRRPAATASEVHGAGKRLPRECYSILHLRCHCLEIGGRAGAGWACQWAGPGLGSESACPFQVGPGSAWSRWHAAAPAGGLSSPTLKAVPIRRPLIPINPGKSIMILVRVDRGQ
jgi:hypothetical protein